MTFYYQDEAGVHQGDSDTFYEMTRAQWTGEMRFDSLGDDLTQMPLSASDYQLMRLLLPNYRAYRKKPPKIAVKRGMRQGRHSVIALEAISKGTIVTEYLGEWIPIPSRPSGYRWGSIDGLHYRNYGGMVEDGFPNLGAFHLYGIDDIPLRVVFVALENIAMGDPLTIHYGMNHSVKLHYHTEYRLDPMIQFFQTHSLQKILKRLKELRIKSWTELGWRGAVELENLSNKLRYLFQTPSALFSLLRKRVWDPGEVFERFKQPDFRYFLLNFPLQPNARQREVLRFLEIMEKFFALDLEIDGVDWEGLLNLRMRSFFSIYIQGVLLGGEGESLLIKAKLWNDILDAVDSSCQSSVEFMFNQTDDRMALIRYCIQYAQETHSPLLSWLQSLDQPILPLEPTG